MDLSSTRLDSPVGLGWTWPEPVWARSAPENKSRVSRRRHVVNRETRARETFEDSAQPRGHHSLPRQIMPVKQVNSQFLDPRSSLLPLRSSQVPDVHPTIFCHITTTTIPTRPDNPLPQFPAHHLPRPPRPRADPHRPPAAQARSLHILAPRRVGLVGKPSPPRAHGNGVYRVSGR